MWYITYGSNFLPDPKSPVIYKGFSAPQSILYKKINNCSFNDLTYVRRNYKKRLSEYFSDPEYLYGYTPDEIVEILKNSRAFSRLNLKTINLISASIFKLLSREKYFNDNIEISNNYYSSSLLARLIRFGILSYSDLSFYILKLTEGQQRYFFSNIMKLPGLDQQYVLLKYIDLILDRELYQNLSNPITVDWAFVGITSSNMKKCLQTWGVFSPLELKNVSNNLVSLWDKVSSCFQGDRDIFFSTINKIYDMISGVIDRRNLLPAENILDIKPYTEDYSYKAYLEDNNSNKAVFENLYGLDSVLKSSKIGLVSVFLNMEFLLKPFFVMERVLCLIGLINPLIESIEILSGLLHVLPPSETLGCRIKYDIILRSGLGDKSIEERLGFYPEYNIAYKEQLFNGQGNADALHALNDADMWKFACNIPLDSDLWNIYTISSGYITLLNIDSFREDVLKAFDQNVKENYSSFHQILGWRLTVGFSGSKTAALRSKIYNQYSYLYDSLSYFSSENGLRYDMLPNRFIYENGKVKSPFKFDPYDLSTINLLKKLLIFEKLANSIPYPKKGTDFVSFKDIF